LKNTPLATARLMFFASARTKISATYTTQYT